MLTSRPVPEAGQPAPLGSLARDGGVNFAVASEHATAVELCLYDASGNSEQRRLRLAGPHQGTFHGFVPGLAAGQLYGLRAHGAYAPAIGNRYNPNKLLLDPYAREIVGRFEWRPEHHGYVLGEGSDTYDRRDNAAWALKARVAPPPQVAAGATNAPHLAAADLVLYELHVKGFSRLLPGLPSELRGRYAALAHPLSIAHFKRLGVTTLSLLPVQYHLDEPMLPPGLVNYWGYNTLGFFCPDPRLATNPSDPTAVNEEFRGMVATLHEHGLEVVLDVVFNHTPEGNEQGPTISFRGLDQKNWYRVDEEGALENFTACGNTLNLAQPQTERFVLDALRYWVQEMGVDGFRFDLAAVLGRGEDGQFRRDAAFFRALLHDPVLARVHLIAEPWDAGPLGYRVGDFPGRFMEWNDKFRDAARGFWLGTGSISRAEFALRFAASPDIYQGLHPGQNRQPTASINFLSVHDGYTLADLVSHSHKRNHANGEDNRDGRDDELCANFGAERATNDPAIRQTRMRVRRALMATLALAQGTPMLCAGDEFGNSQQGNNNAWNQDNTVGWLDWPEADYEFGTFVAGLLELRRTEPLLRPGHWGQAPLRWLHLADEAGPLACVLGDDTAAPWLLVFHPAPEPAPLALPPGHWRVVLDSSGTLAAGTDAPSTITLAGRSLSVLRRELL